MTAAHAIAPIMDPSKIADDFRPTTEAEFIMAMASWRWRLFSGFLYKIMTKEDEHQDGSVVPFQPNIPQRMFVERLHYRNVILKARQLGFTTLIAIMWLDHALFQPDQRVGIIAHTKDDAAIIFRDKVLFAYKNMPDFVRTMYPLAKKTETELVFAHNNSSVRVAVSMRSGTIHRLHISEMGKIAAKFPQKAVEIVSGSLPAVPMFGIAVIESTAEGKEGHFFEYATRAERRAQDPRALGPKEWKFHFFAWHDNPSYRMPANDNTPISATEHLYFDEIQKSQGKVIDLAQRRFYIATRESECNGDPELMWREYPSSPAECWQRSVEGTYYAPQIARARAEGRIGHVPFVSNVPVHTFWDIGSSDGTAIWLMQLVGLQHRFPLYIEAWSEGYSYFVRKLRETGQVFGTHYLPHDAAHTRQMQDRVAAPRDLLQELAPDWSFDVVPRVTDLQHGITLTREQFHLAWFDEEGCKEGLQHIELYHKKWSTRIGAWTDEPEKQDGHSEAADALRQWAQGFDETQAYGAGGYSTLKQLRRKETTL